MALNIRNSRVRKVEEALQLRGGPPLVVGIDEERELLEQGVHAARAELKPLESLAAMPFSVRARGCTPAASAERIFSDAAIAQRLESAQQSFASSKAALAAFQQLHGLGPNGIAREVFRYELAAMAMLSDRPQQRGEASGILDPANVADTLEKLRAFPPDEWEELLEGFDDLAAAVMTAASS